MRIQSQAATVILHAVLRRAEQSKAKEIPETEVGAPRRIIIDYDLKADTCAVETDASPMVLTGCLAYAHSLITQNQVMQRIPDLIGKMAVEAKLARKGPERGLLGGLKLS